MMSEQQIADFLPASHKDALRLLTNGLCRIRESALEAPQHAMEIADAMHNIPGILAGEDRAGEPYLQELLKRGQALMDDRHIKDGSVSAPDGYCMMPSNPRNGTLLHAAWLRLAGQNQPSIEELERIYFALFAAASQERIG